MKISRVDAPHCQMGEGPLWDVAEQALYYLDVAANKVHRYEPRTGKSRTWDAPAAPGAMALRAGGGAVVALRQDGVYTLDFASGAFAVMTKPSMVNANAMFNDGVVDARGRFLIGAGDLHYQDPKPIGGLYQLNPDHTVSELDSGILLSNGPCFSPDGKTLYFSDSFTAKMYAYDYDIATGKVANKRVHIDTKPLDGSPDGATVDRDGLIWMAVVPTGKIVVFRPDGKIERTIEMPVKLSVSVMFGGANLDQLYVTTLDPGALGHAAEEGGGYLYVIEGLGTRGLAEHRYAG